MGSNQISFIIKKSIYILPREKNQYAVNSLVLWQFKIYQYKIMMAHLTLTV